ncbi:MAG TPA: low affinity iron permease family protein [Hanamia sp.]
MKNNKNKSNRNKKGSFLSHFFNLFSATTKATGSVYAFIASIVIVIIRAITRPVFKFSDTRQLVINTGTTIVTFLMFFIIQHAQNKDTIARQHKLGELLAASHSGRCGRYAR